MSFSFSEKRLLQSKRLFENTFKPLHHFVEPGLGILHERS